MHSSTSKQRGRVPLAEIAKYLKLSVNRLLPKKIENIESDARRLSMPFPTNVSRASLCTTAKRFLFLPLIPISLSRHFDFLGLATTPGHLTCSGHDAVPGNFTILGLILAPDSSAGVDTNPLSAVTKYQGNGTKVTGGKG